MKRGEEGKVSETVETYYQRTFREVREQALLEGKFEGKLEGKLESQTAMARRLLADGTFTLEKVADLTGLTTEQVRGLTV
jgi:predicted transposase/invertase (TIGR01784 family)